MIYDLRIKKPKKIILVGLLIAILNLTSYFLNPPIAHAQSLSLSIYPPLLEIMIQPGKSITQVYKLANNGETDLAFTSKIVSFEPADEFGNIKINNQQSTIPKESRTASINNQQFLSWFSFQNADLNLGEKFLLKAGKEQEIVLKLKVPEGAQEDDYYATLLFETIPGVLIGGQPALPADRSAAQAQAQIGTNILLTVSKDGKPLKKAEIIEFRIMNHELRIIDSFDRPQFTLRIKNTGKAFFKPIGVITITGWLGQKYLLDLLPENVLVNSIRQIRCQFDNEFGPCQFGSRFLVGRYRAQVEFGLDKLSADYSAETTFFALPIKLILGLVIAIAIIGLVKSRLRLDKFFL